VGVNITHTYIGDLTVTVTSPSGTAVTLHNRTGSNTQNIVGTYPTTLTVDGPGSLADFIGQPTAGNWKLSVQDGAAVDTGTLNSWTLYVTGQSYTCNSAPTCSDGDGDGYGNPASALCAHPQLDCNDANAAVHPGATEICNNGIDDDCNGLVDSADPACASTCVDHDGDGYGNPGDPSCPKGSATDCDDNNAAVNPGATEIPRNGIDDDCNPATPGGCTPQLAEAATTPAEKGTQLPVDVGVFTIAAGLVIAKLRAKRRRLA